MEIQVENKVDIEQVTDVELTASNVAEVSVADDTALDVSVVKKEYKIVGDEVYIAKLYEDAPQWMKDLVQLAVDNTMASESTALLNSLVSQLNQFAVSYVPLNTYTQSILDLSNADTAMHNTIETLNSNFNDGLNEANSQIIDLQSTKASKTEVATKVIETITAQLALPTSDIGATIANLQQAIVNGDSANADSITTLTSVLEGEVDARATAVNMLNTYVGIDSTGIPTGDGLIADITILKKQNDGVIETTTNTYDVMLNPQSPELAQLVVTAEPYASWKAMDVTGEDTRLAHIGDVYVKYANTATGAKEYIASYKFIKTAVDTTSPYATDSEGYTWALIVDQAAQDAYNQALNAYDLADNKRRVFTTTPSGPYDVGDLWIKQEVVGTSLQRATVGRVSGYLASEWSIAGDSSVLNLQTVVDNVQAQVDSKVDTYYQDTIPFTNATNVAKKIQAGDYWYCTLTGGSYTKGKIYKYVESANGGNYDYTWTESADVTKYVFDLADGKASIFTTSAQPSSYKLNDLMVVTTSSFSNGTTTFTNGVVLTAGATRTTGFVAADWTKKINDTEALNSFVNTTYTPTVTNLQNQVDGKVENWYTLSTSDPKTAWTDATTRAKHDGDLWYQTDTKNSYYYSSSTNSWNTLEDSTALQALANAATAQSTADGKITTFYQPTNPVAEGIGDLWIDSDNNNKMHRWNGSSWEYLRDATKDAEIAKALADAQTAQNTADSKIESFYQTTAPVTASEGDIWFDTDDGNKIYTYRNGVWTNTQDSKIGQALLDAAYAQATADGKIVTYYQAEAPIAEGIGDIWIDSDNGNKMYRWNGTSWGADLVGTMVANSSAVTNLTTELSNGTTTWAAADSVLENSLHTEISNEGARVESKFAYNSNLSLNGVSYNSGFGLSNSTGTGIGSEFWIDATKLKFTNSATTGRTAPFTIDASGATPQITFNGKVSFSNVTDVPKLGSTPQEVVTAINTENTTTIDGGRITTGSITANQIAANSITGNNIVANVAIAAPVINGGVINGGVINGVNITGAVIKASWIDYSSTGHLTNWTYFTPATMPAQYAANFAHNSTDGSLLVDSNGYVRLPKVGKVVIDAYSYRVGRAANVYNMGNLSFAGYSLNVRSYDSYTTTSTRRLLDRNSRIVFDSTGYFPADSIPFLQLTGGIGAVEGATGSCTAEWRIGTDTFSYYGYTADRGSSPKLHTTRLAKNGVYLFDVTGSDTIPTYDADFVSSGIATHVHAIGSSLSVTIVKLAHNIVDYIGQDADIAIGPCSGYASEGLNVSMSVVIPTGTETY